MFSFFLLSFREGHGKTSIFVVKMALATICGGKILDKLRCKKHNKSFILLLIVKNEIIIAYVASNKSANSSYSK